MLKAVVIDTGPYEYIYLIFVRQPNLNTGPNHPDLNHTSHPHHNPNPNPKLQWGVDSSCIGKEWQYNISTLSCSIRKIQQCKANDSKITSYKSAPNCDEIFAV